MYDKQAIPTVDERIQQNKPSIPFNPKIKENQKTPLTNEGYQEYEIHEDKRPDGKTDIKISHAGGPILGTVRKIQQSLLAQNPTYDDNIIQNWQPQMAVSVVDDITGTPLTAAQISTNYNNTKDWIPQYFANPMQDLDYIVIEAMGKNTFVGPLMDSYTKFIMGTGFRPELELINPDKDPDKNEKEIETNQDIIQKLRQIDAQLNYEADDKHEALDVSFVEKVTAMISVANLFNRSALVFGYDKPITIDDEEVKGIPSSLKFAHARDLGIIKVTPDTWRLEAVQWRNAYYMLPAKDMIYLWNPLVSAKYHNAWWYGGSMIMPMLDASRVLRKIVGVDFPAMAEATWAGMFILAVKPQGADASQKQTEYSAIASNLVRGGPNILMEDPEDIDFHSVDFAPKVTEFKDLTEFLLKYSVASLGLPHTMFFDESASNRSTMLGKIQLAISTVINPTREMIGRQIAAQWYQRWFRLLYKDTEEYKKFRIKMVFDDLHIEEWFDKIEAVNELDSRKQLSDKAYGELAGVDNYAGKVDPDAETMPGGDSKNSFKFGDEKGSSFEMKKKTKEF